MSMTDPIADLLTRIRNGLSAKKRWVDIPSSNFKKRIIFVLKEENYIKDFFFIKDGVKEKVRIFLKYDFKGNSVIESIKRIIRCKSKLFNLGLPHIYYKFIVVTVIIEDLLWMNCHIK